MMSRKRSQIDDSQSSDRSIDDTSEKEEVSEKRQRYVFSLDAPDELAWWQTEVIYQIYPRSFFDSNGDGIGDIPGIIQKMDYLSSLGIGAIWLSPVYKSPMKDFGYDISDFCDIDPIFGTLDDMKELIRIANVKGLRIIMDFVPNHTSDQHDWFIRSRRKEMPYDDYYVWKDGVVNSDTGKIDPPNNWLSVFGGKAWTWCDERKQFYLHQFLKEQPDLNFRCDAVRKELLEILKFWVDAGIAGFRMDAIVHLFEDCALSNNPVNPDYNADHQTKYRSLIPVHTSNLQETYDLVAEWAKFLGKEIPAMLEISYSHTPDVTQVMKYYETGVAFPFNFNLLTLSVDHASAGEIRQMIDSWLENMPPGAWPNWVLSNHDKSRATSRRGDSKYANIFNMLLLLLPGTPTVYYGEEIGMVNGVIPTGQTLDTRAFIGHSSRDPYRTPMQWDDSKHAGFCPTAQFSWLPIAPGYEQNNVLCQETDVTSYLSIFKSLVSLRRKAAFLRGSCECVDVGTDRIFAFKRCYELESYLVVLCFGNEPCSAVQPVPIDFSKDSSDIVLSTPGLDSGTVVAQLKEIKQVQMRCGDGFIARLSPAT